MPRFFFNVMGKLNLDDPFGMASKMSYKPFVQPNNWRKSWRMLKLYYGALHAYSLHARTEMKYII